MPISRRKLLRTAPALGLPVMVLPSALRMEFASADDTSLPSAVYTFAKLPVRSLPNGHVRDILRGKLATGESLEVHETTLPPGASLHAPHHHVHSEMWLVREGNIEVSVKGKTFQLGPGDVGFVRSGEEHGVTNVGATPATYFVVAVGPGAVASP
jgi:mannose-6-phosphate isomerase-like protein (cupin superfamily)